MARTAVKFVHIVKKYPCLYNSKLADNHWITSQMRENERFVGSPLYAWMHKQHNTFLKLRLMD